MTTTIITLISFALGVLVGACLIRWGISLGNRLTISAKEEIPLDEEVISITQE